MFNICNLPKIFSKAATKKPPGPSKGNLNINKENLRNKNKGK